MRLFHVLRELGARGWPITLVAPASPAKIERGAVLREAGITLRSVRRPASRGREAMEATLATPAVGWAMLTRSWASWQAEVYRTELAPTLDDVFAEFWDAVLIEHDWAVRWARMVPDTVPIGLVFQNLTGDLHRRRAGTEHHRVARVLARRESWLAEREVAAHAPRLSRAIACSRDDAERIEERWGIPSGVVPNGTETARLAGVRHDAELTGRLVFTGTMSYPPNAQAAIWMAREVLPLVRVRRPDATLQLVGGGAPPEVEALGTLEGVDVTGRVPALEPVLARAEVAVAPLLSGGGTKLKVLEALAAGRPLVATPVGAEGIEVTHGEHLLVAADAPAFARAVVDLLNDRPAAISLAERGRTLVAERYDWSAVGGRMDAVLRDWLLG
ncbi:glycosyltransferase family 4 protein [Patulibacter minatonensis]|uniref:glycosyltransferase family 4 protein n=1 Tax=Patulibacter minatonensis TaxID=298163 RepID=UPI00056423CE|nr:glycosyltransferase family 4 protein [Patulibacter minatonensis]